MAKPKPKVKAGSKKSRNKGPTGKERNYEFVVEYTDPVSPKKNK